MIPLLVFGLNHDTAPVAIREKVAFAPEMTVSALQNLVAGTPAVEAAILSTCNRTELYVTGDCSEEKYRLIRNATPRWLAKFHQLDVPQLAAASYIHEGEAAVAHMVRVACGLDSMVLGEPQILGQLKSCYAVAQEAQVLGSELHSVFQMVFSAAKRVRTETAIGRNPVSVASAAVNLARRIFSDLAQDRVLLIGSGETIDLAARHLREQGVVSMTFANRTLERARLLADEFSARAILLSDIPDHLPQADIVISSTASQLPVLGKGAVESALKKRKHRPILMVDIAVPRDIEPEVGELEDVYLYTVDDLRDVIDDNKQSREVAAAEAHIIIDNLVLAYTAERRARYSVAAIKSYRQYAEQLKASALQKALKDLDNGQAPDQVVRQLANSLTNKLLHSPTRQLRRAGEEGQDEILALSRQLLGFPAKSNGQ